MMAGFVVTEIEIPTARQAQGKLSRAKSVREIGASGFCEFIGAFEVGFRLSASGFRLSAFGLPTFESSEGWGHRGAP
jgi:hypothetical protein